MTALAKASLDKWAIDEEKVHERIIVDSVYNNIQGRTKLLRDTGRMLIEGYTHAAIALRIGRSVPSVNNYVRVLRDSLASLLDPVY